MDILANLFTVQPLCLCGHALNMHGTVECSIPEHCHARSLCASPDCECESFIATMYEQDLPDSISQADYDKWFESSKVIDGVRMGVKI